MATRAERLAAASTAASAKISATRKPRPQRKALKALVEPVGEETLTIDESAADSEPELPALALVEKAGADEAVTAAPAPAAASSPTTSKALGKGRRAAGVPKLPAWRDLATPAAPRGMATADRRLNVPASPALMSLVVQRDEQLDNEGRPHRINRSDLLAAAIEVFGADQRYWIDQWKVSRDEAPDPATTALQGRVSEQHLAHLKKLRYWQPDDGPRRALNTGPILALIVQRILKQD